MMYISALLRTFTFRRLLNLVLNETSYLLSRILHRPVMFGLPWSVSIEPTTHCNLRCPECPSGLRKFTRPTGTLQVDQYKEIVDELSPHLCYLTLYFQGEPMLHRQFAELVAYAKQKGIFVATSTNGHFLDENRAKELVESGLDRLIISLDGTDQETYSRYRTGGELETVKQGIRNVIMQRERLHKRYPRVELQFLVLGTNQHQVQSVKSLANELKVDRSTYKSAQLYDYESSPFLTTISKYSRYETIQGKLKMKSTYPDYCHRLWHSAVITWDGRVVPCCFDKDASHSLGNLNEQSFTGIWHGEKYRHFRKAVFSNRRAITICSNCSEGLR